MIAASCLVAYALFAGTAGPGLLKKAAWPERAPGIGIVAWQMLSVSVVFAVVLAGVALAVPTVPSGADVVSLLVACAVALHHHLSTPGGWVTALVGLAASSIVAGRLLWSLVRSMRNSDRARGNQLQKLLVISRREKSSGALVIEHPAPTVYCLPGRYREVVVTTGALSVLRADQLAAVLAHERAHMAGRHHLVLEMAISLRTAFPRVPVFVTAEGAVRTLVEMRADDIAVRVTGRTALAGALVRLAEGAAPGATLAAGGVAALARVRRLVQPPERLGRTASIGAGLISGFVLVIPAVIIVLAAVVACPELLR